MSSRELLAQLPRSHRQCPSARRVEKNDHIGFEITYWFKGIIHKFRPDYLVRPTNGKTVIVEVKVQDDHEQTKREFLSEWVRAVNGHGIFGEWTADSLQASEGRAGDFGKTQQLTIEPPARSEVFLKYSETYSPDTQLASHRA